ncbi:diguanylate cyclase [Novosphingobium flavum]|uniref:diguanylate cyclase n=1 Tax=Novosphingobium aerophilum TaxID=2839843 RepID=A0A7X1FAF8_9SPHN|nr:diguanylate cyclase [Novosphingobium aerophilum]MBC2653326.1 diguanylate cyclase [Novosphingobium aerophilum]MBC2663408.1 diguanylate cyclase [Novosphingobium aerophilum]
MSSSSHQTFAAAWARLSAVAVAMGLFLVLLIGLSGAHPAGAHVPGGSADHLTACIAPVRAGDHPAGVLAHPERFDCRRPAADWGPGSYWIRLTLPTGSPATTAAMPDRQLRFVPLWQQDLAVSVRDSRGRVVTRRYSDADLSRAIDFGGALAVPLDSAGSRGTDVLVRVDGALNASGLIGDPHLLDADTLHHDEVLAIAALAAFGGLGVGMLCYNLVLWLTIRERFQLTYCLSLLAMLTYVWASSGAMVQVFPDIAHTYRLATAYIMLGFASALSLQFITDFIEEDCLPSGLRRMARQFGIVYILAGLGVALAAPDWRHFADRLYALAYVPLPILLVSLTTIAWRRGSRSIRVLAVAWALPLLMALLRIAHALNVIEYGPLVQYALIIGMSFEAVLSSLAMSYRIKLITAERDRARADERAARQLANVDSLTGLLNRRALLEQLIAWRSPEPLRLLLVDIDRFKAVNDHHGHLVGDEVLRAVAEVLAIRADLNASVARLGGEEFALIGAAAELPEAVALGIIADIRSRPMAAGVRVTVSVGMAEGPVRGEDDWRELYRRADAALYQAKSDGRNRAVHAPTVQPAPPSTAAA